MASDAAMGQTPEAISVGPYRYAVTFDGDAAYDYAYHGNADDLMGHGEESVDAYLAARGRRERG